LSGALSYDVHTHYMPEEFLREARAGQALDGVRVEQHEGTEWLAHRQGFRYPTGPRMYDIETRLSEMDAHRIDVGVVSLQPMLFFYWAPATEVIDWARFANDQIAKLVAQAPHRFVGLATLPMQDPDAAAAELRRAVTELGLRGAEIGPSIEDVPLDAPALRPVLATAQELGVPLLLHPYYVGPRSGLEDFYLVNLLGNPLQTTISASRLILSGTLDELPTLDVVLCHGGGFLPYQQGRLDHGWRVRPEAGGASEEPSSYLRRFHYDTITHAAAPLRFLLNSVGADRVVYGTDYPFDMAAGSLREQVSGAGLSPEELALVGGTNAARLFGPPSRG
jgi:aminocarboxymuconate-semialdehyde decarboxylase